MSSRFTRDVAKELDRRQRRRKLVMFLVWVGLVAAAIVYVRCGRGWGLGTGTGTGTGAGTGSGTAAGSGSGAAAAKPCAIRVTAAGTMVDGKAATTRAIVAACGKTKQAEVIVTGDAREGAWKELCDALVADHIAITVHGDAQVCPP